MFRKRDLARRRDKKEEARGRRSTRSRKRKGKEGRRTRRARSKQMDSEGKQANIYSIQNELCLQTVSSSERSKDSKIIAENAREEDWQHR